MIPFPGNFDPQPEFVLGREENLFPPAPPPIVGGGGVSAKLRDTVWLISRTHRWGGVHTSRAPLAKSYTTRIQARWISVSSTRICTVCIISFFLIRGVIRPDLVS